MHRSISGSDIQAALMFAKQHGLKLAVRNTYLGRSTARGGFLIWTHNIKKVLYDSNLTSAPGNTFHGNFFFSHFQAATDRP